MKNKIILVISILMLVSTINAFGISSPYWEDNPLVMQRGETKIVNLNIQNLIGEEDANVKIEIIEGADITSIKEDTYTIKSGTSDTIIPLEITLPENVSPGEIKKIKVDFKKVSENEGGIAMGTGMSVYFDVITSGESNAKENNKTIIIGIGAIVLILILFILLKKKKK